MSQLTDVEVCWRFGDDTFTKKTADYMYLQPDADEVDRIIGICSRRDSLPDNHEAIGRSLAFPSHDTWDLGPAMYDTLEISGFGYRPFRGNGILNISNRTGEILLPSTDNFSEKHPEVTTTDVFDPFSGQFIRLHDQYSFTGGYTMEQAVKKTAVTAVCFDALCRNITGVLTPFPLAIGRYNEILGPEGGPAYFLAFKVPFGGRREGIWTHIYGNKQDWKGNIVKMVKSIPIVAAGARAIHDGLQITHNQLGPQNVCRGPHPSNPKSSTIYIADWSTAWPVGHGRASILSRASDLMSMMSSQIATIHEMQTEGRKDDVDEQLLGKHIYTPAVEKYTGEKLENVPPKNLRDIFPSLVRDIGSTIGEESGSNMIDESSWPVITSLQDQIRMRIS